MSDTRLPILDQVLREFSTKLRDDLKINSPESNMVASTIKSEIQAIDLQKLPTLIGESPLSLKDRFDVLMSFWSWRSANPADGIGQIISLNYMCFVFLNEACFKVLRTDLPTGSVAKKCCNFLSDNPIRAFRNALSHGNWRPTPDNAAIDYWARKGADPNESLIRFRESVQDLNFWHSLSIATAYASLSAM